MWCNKSSLVVQLKRSYPGDQRVLTEQEPQPQHVSIPVPTAMLASAGRPGNRQTHLLDRRSGKSRQKMKSAEVPLLVWSKGGLECK